MAETLVEFDAELSGPRGESYRPQACGAPDERGRWRGWIEFVRTDGHGVVRTGRETTQRDREQLLYWAEGLTLAYLEGALERALDPDPTLPLRRRRAARPAFEGSAPGSAAREAGSGLDPYDLFARGKAVLQARLAELDKPTLREIIRAHRLSGASPQELSRLSRAQLASLIVRCVEERG